METPACMKQLACWLRPSPAPDLARMGWVPQELVRIGGNVTDNRDPGEIRGRILG